MAQKTTLQPYGLPGVLRSFAAKNNHPVDWITALTAIGIPGPLRSFAAKDTAAAGIPPPQVIIIG